MTGCSVCGAGPAFAASIADCADCGDCRYEALLKLAPDTASLVALRAARA